MEVLEYRKGVRNNVLTLLIILVVSIWGVSAVLIFVSFNNWEQRGAFGDLFGMVNSLFSGLAFAGLLYTIILQKRDLALQREEIIQNREELRRAAKAQESSEKSLAEQVEQMKISAKLNALKTLIDYYNVQISNQLNSPEIIAKAKERRKETIKEIDLLIDRISDDDFE